MRTKKPRRVSFDRSNLEGEALGYFAAGVDELLRKLTKDRKVNALNSVVQLLEDNGNELKNLAQYVHKDDERVHLLLKDDDTVVVD